MRAGRQNKERYILVIFLRSFATGTRSVPEGGRVALARFALRAAAMAVSDRRSPAAVDLSPSGNSGSNRQSTAGLGG